MAVTQLANPPTSTLPAQQSLTADGTRRLTVVETPGNFVDLGFHQAHPLQGFTGVCILIEKFSATRN